MISVVIPAYNEEKNIAKTLESLTKQIASQPFEVVVVDNNSTDRTAAIATTFMNQLNLTVIHEKQPGRGAARAAGFAAATGDIICSTDADTVLPPAWLETITKPIMQKRAIATAGISQIKELHWVQNKLFFAAQLIGLYFFIIRHGHPWFSGFSAAITKEAYAACGGFRRDLNALEDVEIADRIAKQGKIKLVIRHPIISSARRLRAGLGQGLKAYVRLYIDLYIKKKDHVYLSNVR